MPELRVKVPSEVVESAPDIDWAGFAEESIRSRFFELQLTRSKEIRRALLRLLAEKSKLTEGSALELGRLIKRGRFERLKRQGLV